MNKREASPLILKQLINCDCQYLLRKKGKRPLFPPNALSPIEMCPEKIGLLMVINK